MGFGSEVENHYLRVQHDPDGFTTSRFIYRIINAIFEVRLVTTEDLIPSRSTRGSNVATQNPGIGPTVGTSVNPSIGPKFMFRNT